MSSSVRIEDYYSDQESPPPPSSSRAPPHPNIGRHGNTSSTRSSGSNRSSPASHYRHQYQHQQAPSPMYSKRMYRAMPPRQYYAMSDHELTAGSEEEEEDDDEEEIQRAMHNLGLQDHRPFARYPASRPLSHRSSVDYELHGPPTSPAGYYGPPPPPMAPYMMPDGRYPPPMPPPMPPHPQWMPYQQHMMMDDMSAHPGPLYPQQPMDLAFVRRSGSSRSYNRRNRPPSRSTAGLRHGMFLSRDPQNNELDGGDYDDEDEDEDDYNSYALPPLSRQSSIGSNSGGPRPPPFARKRAHSLSAMPPPPPPPFMMDSPRRQPVPGNYFYHPPPPPPPPPHQRMNPRFAGGPRRVVHSVPSSPQLSVSSSDSSSSEDYLHHPHHPRQHQPHRRASINVASTMGHPGNLPNGRLGRSMSFSGGFPPVVPPPPPPPPSAAMPSMVLHPPPSAAAPNAMYSLPLGGDLHDPMMHSNQQQQQQQQPGTAPVTPMENPPSANASAAGDVPMNPQAGPSSQSHPAGPSMMAAANLQQPQQQQQPPPLNMQMPPPPPPPPPQQMPPWGNGFPTSPGDPAMFGQQQGMMQPPPPPPPPQQMMLPPMFNNPMMNQNPMWNFMPEMMFGGQGGDFPLPFMYSNDPNLIAQAMNGNGHGGPQFGGPGAMEANNAMHSPHVDMNGNPMDGPNTGGPAAAQSGVGAGAGAGGAGGGGPSEQDDMMRRSGSGNNNGNEPPHGHDMMMMPPPPPPPNSAPMLKRGLSMLGGLFGQGHRDDFNGGPPHPMFGHFSAPIQAQSKKEAKLQRQYEELGTFYCWRRLEGPDQHFETFNIENQKLIKKKLSKAQPQTQIMLKKEKKLPGEIMIDLQKNRGCYLVKMGGDPVVVMLEIEQKSYGGGNSYIFGGDGQQQQQQQQQQQGPPQW